MIFSIKFLTSFINGKDPEPQLVISALAGKQLNIGSLALGSGSATLVIRWYGTLINGSHGRSMTLFSHLQVHKLDRAWGMTG
jgi:hypothetical protein